MANPIGRPTDYSPETVELVCQSIATNAKGLDQLCEENPEMPGCSTIKTWIRKHPEFRAKYLQAKELQAHILMDKTISVANRDDYDESDSLLKVNRDKLKIDTYKHNAARLNIRDYGDKKEYSHKVDVSETANKVSEADDQYKKLV